MKTIQSIFDLAFAAGVYPSNDIGHFSSDYMCDALEELREMGTITVPEYDRAFKAIRLYLLSSPNPRNTLAGSLERNGHPSDIADCVAIYRNWETRPKLTGVRFRFSLANMRLAQK